MEENRTDIPMEKEESQSFNSNDAYFEDDSVYAPFNNEEALEIIIPTEENELTEAPQESPVSSKKHKKASIKLNIDIGKLLSAAVDFIFLTGDVTVNLFTRLFKALAPLLLFPLKFIFGNVKKLFRSTKTLIKKGPSSFSEKIKVIAIENAEKKIKEGKKKKPSYIGAFFSFIFSENRLLKSAVNLAFPVVIFLALYNIYNTYSSTVYALEVLYNGVSIGYIENKEVFDEGRAEAQKLIFSTGDDDGISPLATQPVYKVARVAVNELSNPSMISENIIACSDINYIRACGIYIDGEFLCAVRNESDAITVFDYLLEPYKKKAGNSATVAFVEEIEYVSGLYPENSDLLWDSYTLRSLLSNPKSEAVYHTFTEGDTVKSVYTKYGITYNQLAALNPGVDLTKPEEITELLVARQTNYVRVKVMRTRITKQSLPFETVEKTTSSLVKGAKKTSQEGVNGISEVTELVTYIDGVESYSTVISQKTVKKPVNKIVLIGTGSSSSGSSGGGSSSGWTWPTRGANHISSYYGYRSYSISGWSSWHSGIDIVVGGSGSTGIPVVAAASGTVERVDKGYRGYGHMILINHGNGVKTRYAHMQPGSLSVYVGQKVSKGQQIGRIGNTGNSTGPHLHFEVIVNGSTTNPLKYVGR